MECLGQTWKQLSKSTYQKLVNLFQAAEKATNFIFYCFLLSKRYIALTKNFGKSFIQWHWRALECFSQNWMLFSKLAPQKLVNLFRAVEKATNFIFYCFLLSKRWIALTKNFGKSFIQWLWRALECFSQNWMLLSKSAPQKLVNLFRAAEKGTNFIFYWLSFIWKVNCFNQKLWEEFYSVTLKGFTMFQPKLNAPFQISPPKTGQFLWSCWKGYKFHISLHSFV